MGDILSYKKEVLPPIDLMEGVDTVPVDRIRLVRPDLEPAKAAEALASLTIVTDNVIALEDNINFLTRNEVNTLNAVILGARTPLESGDLVPIGKWYEDFAGDITRTRQEFGRAKDILNAFSEKAAQLTLIEQSAHGSGSRPKYWLNPGVAVVDKREWIIAFDHA
jgi:hypothetical protein